MLGAFRRPRIEGRFAGDRMRAWDVDWGDADGDFVDREQLRRRQPRGRSRAAVSTMDVDGRSRSAIRAPTAARRSNARIRMTDRPVDDLCARLRARRLRRRRRALGRVPRLRPLPRPVRLRPHDDRRGHGLRRAVRRPRRRRCASRATASASTALDDAQGRPAASPAPRSSAGTAPTRSTPTAGASRSRRWR